MRGLCECRERLNVIIKENDPETTGRYITECYREGFS